MITIKKAIPMKKNHCRKKRFRSGFARNYFLYLSFVSFVQLVFSALCRQELVLGLMDRLICGEFVFVASCRSCFA